MNAASRLNSLQFGLVGASVLAAVLPHLWRLPPLFSLLALLVFVARWAQRAGGGGPIPRWLKLPLVLLFPVFVVLHYGNIFGREPGSALACAMLILKLVETETRRDARACICFASFVLMSALLFDSSLWIALLLFAALALFLAALRELEPQSRHEAKRTPRSAMLADLRSGAVSLLGALPLALCVFVFFPRLSAPLWGRPNQTVGRSGLDERMAPGTIQELLLDDSPAFRVAFETAPPPASQLYWRGPVLWQFDGVAWTRPEYLAMIHDDGLLQSSGSLTRYEVTMEPTQSHWLLALDMPTMTPEGAMRGADMSLLSRLTVDRLTRYSVTSAMHYVLQPTLGRERGRALQLPAGYNPLTVERAQRWRSEFGNDDNAIVAAALAFFHKNFTYTLTPPELGINSVDEFLFSTQQGFCEHFSSAFTYLMRAAGIPARVVTGYQGGYFNEVGNYLVVRQSDAHAWSEVWLEGRGWVRVDPTAAVSPLRVQLGAGAAAGANRAWYQAEWLLGLRNQFDLVNRFWNDAVVQFSALRQRSLLTPFGVDKAEYTQLISVLIGLSSLLLGLFAWWTLRGARAAHDPLDAAYARLCAKLARAGAVRQDNEGPLTFASHAQGVVRHGAPVKVLFDEYASLRYGCVSPSPTAVQAFARAVAALRVHRAASTAE